MGTASINRTEPLWCDAGHLWDRPVQTGTKPHRCPEHRRRPSRALPPEQRAPAGRMRATDPAPAQVYSLALGVALDRSQTPAARAAAGALMRDLGDGMRNPQPHRGADLIPGLRGLIVAAMDHRIYGPDHEL